MKQDNSVHSDPTGKPLVGKEGTSFAKTMGWAAFLTFDLIILGSLVRAKDAGLACPDWPLCYNQLAPAMDTQIFLEWFHRFSALILGGVVLRALYLVAKSKPLRRDFGPQLLGAFGLFLSQCILGGLTVLDLLDPTIVSLHLANALVFLALLIWTAIKAWIRLESPVALELANSASKVPTAAKWALGIFTVVFFGQVLVGGMVSSNHAGLVCPDFPKCHGEWLPQGSYLLSLQAYHRIFAYALAVASVGFSLVYLRYFRHRWIRAGLKSVPALIAAQIGLGIINVFYGLPVWASVSHLGNALLIVTILFAAFVLTVIGSQDKTSWNESRSRGKQDRTNISADTRAATEMLKSPGGTV